MKAAYTLLILIATLSCVLAAPVNDNEERSNYPQVVSVGRKPNDHELHSSNLLAPRGRGYVKSLGKGAKMLGLVLLHVVFFPITIPMFIIRRVRQTKGMRP